MAHKGLSPETVVKAAAELIEQQGRETFSMRALADHLGVKTASLYNHVDHMEGLLAEVCRYGLCIQKEAELQRESTGKRPCAFLQILTAASQSSTRNFTG